MSTKINGTAESAPESTNQIIKKDRKPLSEYLIAMGACSEAIQMAMPYGIDYEKAWSEWPRGDHLLWIFARTDKDKFQLLTLAKAHCANTVRRLMKDKRSINAVDVAIRFGEGNATRDELDAAYAAAAAAAYDAYAADAAADAVAAYAAYAAYATAYAAAYAADADAADADARTKNQQATADICRKYLPLPTL